MEDSIRSGIRKINEGFWEVCGIKYSNDVDHRQYCLSVVEGREGGGGL